jgi:hypothetical protein
LVIEGKDDGTSGEIQTAYHELYAYTMGRSGFILQHVVDAHMAQQLNANSKPIGAVFSVAGLYLYVEKGFTGIQVQQAHRKMGQQKRLWPPLSLPAQRGDLTAVDVMAAPAGAERDAAIDRWCQSVWSAYRDNRQTIIRLLQEYEII